MFLKTKRNSSESLIQNTNKRSRLINRDACATPSNIGIPRVPRHIKIVNCAICAKQYWSQQALAYHMKSHTNERPYKCEPCERDFKCQTSLQSHHRHKHSKEKPFSCCYCPATFVTSRNLTSHTRVIHTKDPSTRQKCNICHKILASSYLPTHMQWHANIMPFSCIICDKKFHSKGNLQIHIRSNHLLERPYPCSKCPATFPLRFGRKHHTLRVHKPEEWYTKECAICSKMLHSEYELNIHMTSHTGEKHFKCSICGIRYGSNSSLKLHHEAVHGGGRQASRLCIMCDKRFRNMGALNLHMLVHTKERPFWCNLCPSSFCTKSKLRQHVRESKVHNNIEGKPLVKFCIMCDKGFANSAGFNAHIFLHTREKPFWCEQCTSSYCRNDRLKMHVQRTHAE
ncbi:putative zinc finger protein [Orchesella cincta]|uniref:Putative zinc finger protein n=1 Tax=Orchesella cincta TaxID=48709 RepID=A0A1D2MHW0_ORCCI|nr:putative zinc finger protein [Orchesella cincta]